MFSTSEGCCGLERFLMVSMLIFERTVSMLGGRGGFERNDF